MELRGTQYTGKYYIAVNSNFLRWCRSIELNSDIHAVVSAKKKTTKHLFNGIPKRYQQQ